MQSPVSEGFSTYLLGDVVRYVQKHCDSTGKLFMELNLICFKKNDIVTYT